MPDALGMAAARLLPLVSVFLFAAIACHGERAGTFGDKVQSRGVVWTAKSVGAGDATSPGSRCTTLCSAGDRRRRSDGSREAFECGVDVEFSGLGSRLVGVDVDIGISVAPDSLRIYALEGGEGIEIIDYDVVQQQQQQQQQQQR